MARDMLEGNSNVFGSSSIQGGAIIAAGAPSSLEVGQLYVATDGGSPNATVIGIWLGATDGPVQILDATPDQLYGLGANRPAATGVSDGTVYRVTDSTTVPAGTYQVQGGAWVAISSAATTTTVPLKQWDGDLTGQNVTGKQRFYLPVGGTIKSVILSGDTPPDAGTVIADVNLNGTTIFTTQANRPTIGNGQHYSNAVPDVTSFNTGDYLTVDLDTIGVQPSGNPILINHTGTTTLTVARPTGAVTGDLIVAFFRLVTTDAVLAVPDGSWTFIDSAIVSGGNNAKVWVARRFDDGTSGPWTFTITSGTSSATVQRTALVRTVSATTPIDAHTTFGRAFSTNGSFNSLTATNVPSLELAWEYTDTSRKVTVGAGPADAGYTVSVGFDLNVAGKEHFASIIRSSAGAIASPTVTWDSATNQAVSRLFVYGGGAPGPGAWTPGKDFRLAVRYQES